MVYVLVMYMAGTFFMLQCWQSIQPATHAYHLHDVVFRLSISSMADFPSLYIAAVRLPGACRLPAGCIAKEKNCCKVLL